MDPKRTSKKKRIRCNRFESNMYILGKQRRELAHEIILTQFDKHSNLKREAHDLS